MNANILIVDDDININNMIKEYLTKSGYTCTQAFSGSEAVLVLKMQTFDLIILDLMLPGMSGEGVLKEIRAGKNVPVIIVSAKDELDTRVDLLVMGADDYLTKPFELKELEARVMVCLRRGKKENEEDEDIMVYEEIILDKNTHEVRINDNPISLTRQEFKILELLISSPKKVFTKQEIYDYAWDDYYEGVDKTINVHISNIRSKIKKYTEKDYIETVWGIGFKIFTIS